MKLTPLDIKKQEFNKAMRGYDVVEVDAFLEMVSDEFEALIREKNELADEVLMLKTQLKDYQNVETTLKETLMSAQKNINASRETSERQAEIIVREAQLKAEKILEKTKLKLAEMKNELVIVKAQKDSFARRLRHLLESQLDLIGVLELDDLGFGKYEKKSRKPRIEQKSAQSKIEFEGVADMLPADSDSTKEDVSERTFENAPDLNWKNKQYEEGEKNEEERTQAPEPLNKNKISDQLII
ncbi:MAG: DivIVA domain-containing protein [bacterium]